jgi:hypothetical protein
MGIRELYLLGIDFDFIISKQTGTRTESDEELLQSNGEVNHFHPEYRSKGELWTMPRLDIQYDAFRTARYFFEEAGGMIYNSSRRTKLDVFPLVEFDDIF